MEALLDRTKQLEEIKEYLNQMLKDFGASTSEADEIWATYIEPFESLVMKDLYRLRYYNDKTLKYSNLHINKEPITFEQVRSIIQRFLSEYPNLDAHSRLNDSAWALEEAKVAIKCSTERKELVFELQYLEEIDLIRVPSNSTIVVSVRMAGEPISNDFPKLKYIHNRIAQYNIIREDILEIKHIIEDVRRLILSNIHSYAAEEYFNHDKENPSAEWTVSTMLYKLREFSLIECRQPIAKAASNLIRYKLGLYKYASIDEILEHNDSLRPMEEALGLYR